MFCLPQELYSLLHPQLTRQMFRRAPLRPISHHQQTRIRVLPDFGQDPDTIVHPLYRTEIRKMDQQLLPIRRKTRQAAAFRIGRVERAVHEIVNDTYLIGHAEYLQRLTPQVVADGRHAIGFFNRELRNREI